MKITVITVCFNSEKTIERTIQSVTSQSWINKEHIIIDGKSTDNTLKIIQKYRSNIEFLISEKDSGIYEAMNKGMALATGDIICFLNSDDYYNTSETLSLVANQMINENLDALFGGVIFFRKDNPSHVMRKYQYNSFSLNKFKFGWMPAHPASFVKRNIIMQNGFFNEKYKIAGDFDFLLRLFKNIKFKFACVPCIFVKMQYGGLSNLNFKSKIIISKEILKSCKNNGIKTNILLINSRFFSKIFEYFIR